MNMKSLITQTGFSLIELLVVIVIMSIISTIIIIRWPVSTIKLIPQAKGLAGDIRYAQNLSMTRGVRYRFEKTSSNSYRITNGTTVVSTTTLGSGIVFGTFTNLPDDLITFDSRGIPYTDTATPGIALTNVATITLNSEGNSATISIFPETGRVVL